MKRAFKCLGLALLTLLLAAGALLVHTLYFKPLSLDWFYTRTFLQFALDNPELLTQMRILEPFGFRSHNGKFSDLSPEHETLQYERLKRTYETLHRYDAVRLVGQDRISYDVFDYFVRTRVEGERWRDHNYPVSTLFGLQSEMPNLMIQAQQVNDATDAGHYIARLQEFPRAFGQLIESLKRRESKGIIPPQFVVTKVLDQIHGFTAPAPADNALAVAFREKLARIPAERMDAATRASLTARVEQSIRDAVIPAYNGLAAYFETLRTKATRNDGVWALPDGDRYYQYAIESNTTTTLTADEIHALGLEEVARITRQMDRILIDAGYAEGTVAERLHVLAASPAQLYADSDEGRAQIQKDFAAIIAGITAGLSASFGHLPEAKVEVRRVPPLSEKTAATAYYMDPAHDHSRPGIFFVNLRDMREQPKYRMHTLAYHEAVPGHHLQAAIAQQQTDLPFFRTVIPFTAYAEGWALYAERLAWETGYEKDPLDNLGRLQDELFRAVRLVVDTGLHAKRWTREQAIDYMMRNTGLTESEVVAEVERYLVDPGQALAYKVGMIRILTLREKARTELGSRFDLREFHDEILKNGAVPLTVLDQIVEQYIARRKAA